MSAGAITGTTGTDDLREDDTILELTGGENPLEFLRMNAMTIFGLIARMSDPDRIEGWRRAEDEHMDTDRTVVLKALDRQAAALDEGQTPPIYHPFHARYDPAEDPLEDDADDDMKEDEEDTDTENEGEIEIEAEDNDEDDIQEDTGEAHTEHCHDIHPDANLEAGEVLVVTRSETTEYIWAARADADDPYIHRVFDGGEQIDEVTIGVDEAFRLVRLDSEKRQTDSVTVETPLEAAANGGDSA